ncbi:MAG: D-2-hydroxyacid dehydrogenase, partial [Alphaproteobacteria bacterium]|nr:D-2-hydroxyacid dehydrogenase [Alphaproteobacteria bacterium]
MTNVLIILTLPEPVRNRYYEHIRRTFPGAAVTMVDHVTKAEAHIGAADVLLTFGAQIGEHADALFRKAKRLRWIQALGTGVDNLADQPALGPEVWLTNLHGIHGAAMSEAALMAMLALSRELPRAVRNQDHGMWERWPSRLLDGTTVGMFGIGAIAVDLAPKCKALGMTTVGISSAKRAVPGFDRMFGRDELRAAVRDLDHFVILTPYTVETKGIVNAAVLAAMKPVSYVINLARGGVVDEDALLAALQDKKIAGAALDVFAKEPLPSDHPFWSMKNVIITPHLGGFYDTY